MVKHFSSGEVTKRDCFPDKKSDIDDCFHILSEFLVIFWNSSENAVDWSFINGLDRIVEGQVGFLKPFIKGDHFGKQIFCDHGWFECFESIVIEHVIHRQKGLPNSPYELRLIELRIKPISIETQVDLSQKLERRSRNFEVEDRRMEKGFQFRIRLALSFGTC